MRRSLLLIIATLAAAPALAIADTVELGSRPGYLVGQMAGGALKDRLAACEGPFTTRLFSIAHRGAPMRLAEHTEQGYRAAAKMGAGIQECDVTFTRDLQLVCRHSQNDLHTTTNILVTDLAAKCTRPFSPGRGAECRTSDISLAEFRRLKGKTDGADKTAKTPATYVNTPATGTLMTHAESIALFHALGAKFTPELKAPAVSMPFNGFSQSDYAQKLIDEYKAAGIPPEDVWPQSFNLDDIVYWIANEPAFGKQAVYLDDSYRIAGWSPMHKETWRHEMADLKAMGVNYIAPPLWVLLTLDGDKIVPSAYAIQARAAGLKIITWTVERSGPLKGGGGWYFRSISRAVKNDGALYPIIDVLARDVGVVGIFSDWPATVTFYANCMGLD